MTARQFLSQGFNDAAGSYRVPVERAPTPTTIWVERWIEAEQCWKQFECKWDADREMYLQTGRSERR